jgi:hypothetical protein
MTERPILFSGPMVRAILEGRKTQTRRVVKPQPPVECGRITVEPFHPVVIDRHGDERPGAEIFGAYDDNGEWGAKCPYGAPGDLLWVRETWAVDAPLDQVRAEREDAMRVEPIFGHGPYYRADGIHENTGLTWRPSIHMPRWACRMVLELTAVRVERLQEISQQDVFREGLHNAQQKEIERRVGKLLMSQECYQDLWDSLNAERGFGWAVNPWVWVVEFRRA